MLSTEYILSNEKYLSVVSFCKGRTTNQREILRGTRSFKNVSEVNDILTALLLHGHIARVMVRGGGLIKRRNLVRYALVKDFS